MLEEALSWPRRLWQRVKQAGSALAAARDRLGLSGKLLLLTVLFVMLAEVLIFVPSVANCRINWLTERLTAARVAALGTEDRGEGKVPDHLRTELLRTAQVRAVSWLRNNRHILVLPPDKNEEISARYDLSSDARRGGFWNDIGMRAS